MVKRGERGRGEGVKGGRDSRDVGAAVVTIGYTTCVHGACRTLRHLPARTFWSTPRSACVCRMFPCRGAAKSLRSAVPVSVVPTGRGPFASLAGCPVPLAQASACPPEAMI